MPDQSVLKITLGSGAGGRPVLRVEGEIDLATADALTAAIARAGLDGRREVSVDLAAVTYRLHHAPTGASATPQPTRATARARTNRHVRATQRTTTRGLSEGAFAAGSDRLAAEEAVTGRRVDRSQAAELDRSRTVRLSRS